ncbi:hypothetical protein [Desulfatiglans anilini]|uniref:hypothetical protein n=1 Tax=Desulfatiglans anilini TaxID=90728 RepID=UPI0004878D80|nr:hypothetical protein [Desulfatiglans anilini]
MKSIILIERGRVLKLTGVVTRIRMRLVPGRHKAFGIACFEELEGVADGVPLGVLQSNVRKSRQRGGVASK